MYVSFKENLKGVNLLSPVLSEPTSWRMSSAYGGWRVSYVNIWEDTVQSQMAQNVTQHSEAQFTIWNCFYF